MKKVTLLAIAAVAIFACGNEEASTSSNVSLNNTIDSVSYAIGINTAENIQKQFAEANRDAIMKGFNDQLDSADLMITNEESQAVIQSFFQKKQMEAQAKQQAEQAAMYGNVQEEGLKFLAENKTKEGVQVTASGLQYIVLKEGAGKQPVMGDKVTVHYVGTTPNGEEFDSSIRRGQPAEFTLGQVIQGWNEGVALMKEGAKYKFFIPQELAYGTQPQRDPNSPIKPYMPLVFEVELIKVN